MLKEKHMKRFLAALSIGLMLAAPVVATAAGAGSTRGNLPPAVDQMLARDMIQLAESQLKVAGFDPGTVDGIFDEQTAAAVRKYQAANGLPVSGLLDGPTRTALLPGHEDAGGES
jgi:peptidoglycan hydrolase-like protein with peptidoglycan-binding domain